MNLPCDHEWKDEPRMRAWRCTKCKVLVSTATRLTVFRTAQEIKEGDYSRLAEKHPPKGAA